MQAMHADAAGIDMVLVGDSVAMVELGFETTQPVTMDDMIHHCKAVARGAKHPLLSESFAGACALPVFLALTPFGTQQSATCRSARTRSERQLHWRTRIGS